MGLSPALAALQHQYKYKYQSGTGVEWSGQSILGYLTSPYIIDKGYIAQYLKFSRNSNYQVLSAGAARQSNKKTDSWRTEGSYLELSPVFSMRIPDLVVLDSLDWDLCGEAEVDSVVLFCRTEEEDTAGMSTEPPEVEGG